MKGRLSLINIDIWKYHKSFMCTHLRSKVTCVVKIIFVEYPPVSGQQGDSIGTRTQFPLDQTHPFLKGFLFS